MQKKKLTIKFKEEQLKLVKEFLKNNNIEIVGEITDVNNKRGRPTDFKEKSFIERYVRYIKGEIDATKLRSEFNFAQSSLYGKFKKLGLLNSQEYEDKYSKNPDQGIEWLNIKLREYGSNLVINQLGEVTNKEDTPVEVSCSGENFVFGEYMESWGVREGMENWEVKEEDDNTWEGITLEEDNDNWKEIDLEEDNDNWEEIDL